MNSTLWTGITLICAGKLQQGLGWLTGSRKHQILGFDQELRGKTMIALGQADRVLQMVRQPVHTRGNRRPGRGG
jgi:uncharacterized protein YjbJ (UPF0337 family)